MTRQILVGGVPIGGGAPVVIQSMLNTKTTDVEGSLKQIRRLTTAGCQIARLAVPEYGSRPELCGHLQGPPLPLVADIHFDYRLAIAAAEGGASKIRINPGNIGGEDRVKAVVEVCKEPPYPHPHRRQRRQSGQASAGKIWPSYGGGPGGKRLLPTWSCWKNTGFTTPVCP